MRNETGRTIQYAPGGPVYARPSEAEIHDANTMVNPRQCDCLECLAKAAEIRAYLVTETTDPEGNVTRP